MESLITEDVKAELNKELADKQLVFLGESEHHIGSDLLAKTQFVKYLVLEHGFKDIAFEADFFALFHTHEQRNIFPLWSRSVQCRELFGFLKEHNVTIWGFDSQFSSGYSFDNFSKQFFKYLDDKQIVYDSEFKNGVFATVNSNLKSLNAKQVTKLVTTLDFLLLNQSMQQDAFWLQAIRSFKGLVLMDAKVRTKGIQIRDEYMASNLSFLTTNFPNKKFIVWAANVHIAKGELPSMKPMGHNYLKLNPNMKTFHIAFSPMKMPYRKDKFIESQHKDSHNLLSLLPDTKHNYLIVSNNFNEGDSLKSESNYQGMLGLGTQKLSYFQHFDALVFIANGERSVMMQ